MDTCSLPNIDSHASPELDIAPLPTWFGPRDRALFGHYVPAQGNARALGVVLCAPFGSEMMCTHRSYRHLAARLAETGFPVLRFDYDGTGDSLGSDTDPRRVSAWIASVSTAIRELKRRAGVERIALFGTRLGATLAVRAAEEQGGVERLVLFAPCASGKGWLREVQIFQRLKIQRDPPPGIAKPEGEEAVGFLITAETASDLKKLDLLKTKSAPAPEALLLAQADPAADEPLARHLASLGTNVLQQKIAGYAEMMRQEDPYIAVVPTAVWDSAIAWLEAACPREASRAGHTEAAQTRVALDGGDAHEELWKLGPGDRLFGVLTEPNTPPKTASRPAIMLLDVGANHHVGPNRLYTRLARAWAKLGFTTLRFDIAGVGDSPARAGGEENHLYWAESCKDVIAAMDALAKRRGFDRFVLGGICSAGYLSFQTALVDARVAGFFLVNTIKFHWTAADRIQLVRDTDWKKYKATVEGRQASMLEHVLRVFKNEEDVRSFARVFVQKVRELGHRRARRALVRFGLLRRSPLAKELAMLTKRGLEALIVYNEGEPTLEELTQQVEIDLLPKERFRLHVIEGADHIFTPLWSQDLLGDVLTTYLRRFAH